jgi:hypothetical protein
VKRCAINHPGGDPILCLLRVDELISLDYQRRGNATLGAITLITLRPDQNYILQSFAVSFQSASAKFNTIFRDPTRSGESAPIEIPFAFRLRWALDINKAETTPALCHVRPKLQANYQKFYARLAVDPRARLSIDGGSALINFPAPRVVQWQRGGYEIQYWAGWLHALAQTSFFGRPGNSTPLPFGFFDASFHSKRCDK